MHTQKSAFKKIPFWISGLFFVSLFFSPFFTPIVAAAELRPQISITSPSAGQALTSGQKVTISWNQTNVDSVTIGLRTKSGLLDWIEFNYQVNINNTTGSYEWDIPAISHNVDNLQIEIIAYHINVGSVTANSGLFTIKGTPNVNQTGATTTLSQSQMNILNLISPADWNKIIEDKKAQNKTTSPGNLLSNTEAYKAVVKVKTFILSDSALLTELSEGSGVIISASGLVLTNDHVVSLRSNYDDSDYDTTFQICLTKNVNNKPSCEYLAKLVARDKDQDIALLQIVSNTGKPVTNEFAFLNLNQTDSSQVNDEVTAIGYPSIGSDTITTTNGIISGKIEEYGNQWIKTDAVISFGSSGGAALNSAGEVIGITTQVSSDVSGELGYVLNAASIFAWVEANKTLPAKNSAIFGKLVDFAKKQKILETSNKFIQLYPGYSLIKPGDWTFEQSSEQAVVISKKSDPDTGYVIVHLLKAPFLTTVSDAKPMLLRYFNENGLSSIIKYTKEKEVKINNHKGKLVTLSIKGKVYNSYIFPNKEYLIWIEYNYGVNDKDKKLVDGIVNSFKIKADKTIVTEVRKYTNANPKFSLTTNADWALAKQVSKVAPLVIRNKKIREAFVTFQVGKLDEATKGLSNEEYINAKKEEANSNNQIMGLIDYKVTLDKTSAHYKLNNNIKDVMFRDATEKTVSDNKILAFDRDYFIKIGNNLLNINLTVYTDNRKVFDKALISFNKMLSTLTLK